MRLHFISTSALFFLSAALPVLAAPTAIPNSAVHSKRGGEAIKSVLSKLGLKSNADIKGVNAVKTVLSPSIDTDVISKVAKLRDSGSVKAKAALSRLDDQATYYLSSSSPADMTDLEKANAKKYLLASHPPMSSPMIRLGVRLSKTKDITTLKSVSNGEIHSLILGQRTLGTTDLGKLRILAMSYAEDGAEKGTIAEKTQAYRWLKALGENGDTGAAAAAKQIKTANPTLLS